MLEHTEDIHHDNGFLHTDNEEDPAARASRKDRSPLRRVLLRLHDARVRALRAL